MQKQKLVVIGNGMAGCRVVQEVLKRDPDRYDITIFGAEPRVNYDRIMLSPVLAGEKTFADIVINDEAWYADNGITLHAGRAVFGDRPRRPRPSTPGSGSVEPYDRPADRHRLRPVRPSGARGRPARRRHLPRPGRCRGHARGGRGRRRRSRDRRRPARARGRARPHPARDEGDGDPPDADADGAPARRGGGLAAQGRARTTRPDDPDRRRYRRDRRRERQA